MSDLRAIAYVSSSSHLLSESELEDLLVNARAANLKAQVTGVLLYDDGNFFQYLEGPADSVLSTFERIRASSKHHGIIQLVSREISERNFQDWSMGFSRAPRSIVLGLAQASWEALVSGYRTPQASRTGVRLLLEFWSKAERRM